VEKLLKILRAIPASDSEATGARISLAGQVKGEEPD
jgi:hypothetical protein